MEAEVESLIRAKFGELKSVLPAHLTPERVARLGVMMMRNPVIAECTPVSVVDCVLKAASRGIVLGDGMGDGHIVPFYNSQIGAKEAQYVDGYSGLIRLVLQSGLVTSIRAVAVHVGDEFVEQDGINYDLLHVKSPDPHRHMQPLTHVYAVAQVKNAEPMVEVMTRAQVDEIAAKQLSSKRSNSWKTHYVEMARKTVIRRICKYLPKSADRDQMVPVPSLEPPQSTVIEQLPAEPAPSRLGELTDKMREEA